MRYREKNASSYFLFQKVQAILVQVMYFIAAYLDENNICFLTAVTFRVNKLPNVSD